jgi:large subunit ribosomal protein L15
MKIHDLKPAPGSKRAARRVGRGIGGKGGKTAGRCSKGRRARGQVAARFEGGQTPITRRTPKAKGFRNPFRVEYAVVNLDTLETFDADTTVGPDELRARGLVAKRGLVKVLGRGELPWAAFLERFALAMSCDALHYLVRTVTHCLLGPWHALGKLAGDRRHQAGSNHRGLAGAGSP